MENYDWLHDAGMFLNFTNDMYYGAVPCGNGHLRINGEYNDRWETKYGGGESYKGRIEYATIYINEKVSLFVCSDYLRIVDIRYAGKFDVWYYENKKRIGGGCHYHQLEKEKIAKIISNIPDCIFCNMVKNKVNELFV